MDSLRNNEGKCPGGAENIVWSLGLSGPSPLETFLGTLPRHRNFGGPLEPNGAWPSPLINPLTYGILNGMAPGYLPDAIGDAWGILRALGA